MKRYHAVIAAVVLFVASLPLAFAASGPVMSVLFDDREGDAPATRYVIVRGDSDVARITIDYGADGTNETDVNASDVTEQHEFQTPGTYSILVTALRADNSSTSQLLHIRITNGAAQDPQTANQNCGRLCQTNDPAHGINAADIKFTPADLWKWLVWAGLVLAAGFVLYFRIINGKS